MWIFSIFNSNTIISTVHTSYYSANTNSVLIVVYFDQQTHACACIRMVENDQKPSFFIESLSWASRVHDEKGTFLLIFECFYRFSTMRTHAQACVRWLKYTTVNSYKITCTHWTGPTWPPLRTQTLKPVSAFQMWIRPSVEPDKMNWKIKNIVHSDHLNTGLFSYSNGRFVSGCQMVLYLNGGDPRPLCLVESHIMLTKICLTP